jgi:hypothetical protein
MPLPPVPSDKRESILSRIEALLATDNTGAMTVKRNKPLIDQDMRPAVALLDGDEIAKLTGARRGGAAMTPQIMTMTPQVFYIAKSKAPQNEDVGPDVNQFRLRILSLIAGDSELKDLVGANGNISLIRMETDLKSGGLLQGQARFDFAISYVLDVT